MGTAPLRPVTILSQICTVWCTKLRKHENVIMKILYCFTVVIGLPGDASDYNEDKRSAVAASMQKRWLSSEATVRARSEILAIWAALKHLSENKDEAMCVVLLRLVKSKKFIMVLSICQHWHLNWQKWANFSRQDVLTLHRWKLPWNCASISFLMQLLNLSLKLITKILMVNQENLERWTVWLTRVCQVACRFGRVSKHWKIDYLHNKMGDRSEWTNCRGIPLLRLPGEVYVKMRK